MHKLRQFFCSIFSNHYNPTELAWNCVKTEMGKKTIVGPDNMKSIALDALNRLYENPVLIASLFKEKHVRYAA